MKTLKQLFDFYISAQIHVALAAAALTKLSLLFYDVENETGLILFTFSSTLISYNFIVSYWSYKTEVMQIRVVMAERKPLIVLNLIGLIYVTYFIFCIPFRALLVISPFVFSVFFYIVPFHKKASNLRSVASFKLFLIAFTWAGATVLFPLVFAGYDFGKEFFIVFLQRFFFVLAIAIPFDIRDIQFDHSSIKTIPQLFGPVKAKIIGSLSLFFFFVLEFYRYSGADLLTTGVIALVAWLLLVFSREDQNRYYTVFWVDTLPILWLILYVLMK